MSDYQALLFVSFGGPDGPDDVIPFLENVLRGKNVPRERMLEVAEHYYHFGGKSPINEQNLALIEAVRAELKRNGPDLPVYFGNRNWHPLLPDTLRQMKDDGITKALAFFTSAYSSYSGCRQYRENVAEARKEVGEGVPEVDLLRKFYNHPGFIEPMIELTREATADLTDFTALFCAHSIPNSMADHCNYQVHFEESSRLVAEGAGLKNWELVFQSRSGPPHQPWLEPDVCDRIEELAKSGVKEVAVIPIGFISDHMEVLFDLDTEARELCDELGLKMARVPTVGTHPKFVSMIGELVRERIGLQEVKRSLGNLGPSHDVCPQDCCLYPRPKRRPATV